MEKLKELINIVGKQVVKQIDVIGNPSNYSSKMQDLYEGIHYQRFSDDEEAAAALYQSSPDNPNYKKLKRRLRKRLINSCFFIDFNTPEYSFTEKNKSNYTALKQLASIEILLNRGARKTAIDIAKKVLHNAKKHEHTDISLYASKKLMRHYGSIGRDAKQFEKYVKRTRYYLKIQLLELEAEEYYERISMYYDKYGPASELVRNTITEYTHAVDQFPEDLNSPTLKMHVYFLYNLRFEIFEDLDALDELHSSYLRYLEVQKYPNKKMIFFVLYNQLRTSIQLHAYKKGEIAAEKIFRILSKRNINWFVISESLTFLYLLSGKYQEAYDLYCRSFEDPVSFRKQHSTMIEKWYIKEAFIHFLIKTGKINTELSSYPPRRFRVSKFLNQVPQFSTDKRWRNIPILIIQLLLLLQNKKYDTIIDKAEALNAYCYRYLRKDYTFRSNCFIKMLLLLPKAGFHKERVIHRAAPLLDKLKKSPMRGKDISDGVEIIPYEKLWEFTLELLSNKVYSG